jgi:hypothetical protein
MAFNTIRAAAARTTNFFRPSIVISRIDWAKKGLSEGRVVLRGGPDVQTTERMKWEAGCLAAVWGDPEWEQGVRRLFERTSRERRNTRNGDDIIADQGKQRL